MRNLKKLLALVLALVMTMSLVAVANAADYKDVTDNDAHAEAIDVMSAIGVIGGYPDGSFKPEGNLTRAEGAKIVAYMLLGDAVDDLPASATFADVPANHWASAPIAYLKSEGIVNGRSATTFDPDANLSGYEFAKMLLTALGYNSAQEGFTGASWAVNVAKLAATAGINDGATMNSGALARGDAAQMSFNTLTADIVEYTGNTTVTTGDVTVSISGKAAKIDASKDKSGAYIGYLDDADNDEYVQFCERSFKDLKVTSADKADAFGRPANEWVYNKKTVGAFGSADADYVFTAKVEEKDLPKALKAEDAFSSLQKANAYTDGKPEGSNSTSTEIKDAASFAGKTGNGVSVEVYMDGESVSSVVIINEILAQIDKIDTKNNEITLARKAGVSQTIDKVTEDDDCYATLAAMAEDDYVLITIAKDGTNYKVQTVAEAITVVGKATSKNSSKNTITVDGTAYEKDKNSAVDVGTFGLSPQYDATLYLDSYGYMLYAEAGAADTSGDKAIVVLDAYQSLDADGKLVHMAKGMLSSGEIVAWQVASTAESLKNNVCTYAEDDGVYTLTRTTNLDKKPGTDHANKTDSDGEYAPVYTAAYTTEIQKTTRGLAIGSSGTVTAYLNADTNYIFYNAGEATVLTGAQTGTPTHVTYEKKGDTWYVTAVFINDEAPVSTSDSSDIIYVVKGVTDTYSIIPEGKDKAEEFKGYDAYLNGEKIDGFYSKESVDNSAFYKVSKDDASGAYILKDSNKHTASTGETAVATAAKVTAISADAGVLKTTVEYDISKAVIVDTTGNDINSASDITESHYVAVMFDAETNVASYVYVVADPAG